MSGDASWAPLLPWSRCSLKLRDLWAKLVEGNFEIEHGPNLLITSTHFGVCTGQGMSARAKRYLGSPYCSALKSLLKLSDLR